MKSAIILTGSDRYESKWHDHAANGQRIAEVLREVGIDGRLRGTRPAALAQLADADLVVIEAGRGAPSADDAALSAWEEAWPGFRAYVERGGPLLVLHNGIAAFGEFPEFMAWVGGRWIDGTSMHPPIARNRLTPKAADHPIVNGLGEIEVFDELYSYLAEEPGNRHLLSHTYEGTAHPLAWVRETGPGRVVFDALGHDVRSYDSPGRCRLLKREALWAIGADATEIEAI